MTDFTHLHVHSYYSLLDGLNSPAELIDAAMAQGQDAIAITDHGNLSAHREFLKAAKEKGIKPILGLEAYISPTDRFDRRAVKKRDDNTQLFHHVVLLAKNQTGYDNLNRLSELAWTEGFYSKPRIDKELLAEYKEGLIVLSGCMNGLIAKAIINDQMGEARIWTKWFKRTFGDDFYMEVQPHNEPELNKALLDLADKYNVKAVATGDCHFAYEADKDKEEAMLILSTGPKAAKGITYDAAKKIETNDGRIARFDALYPERPIRYADLGLFVAGGEAIRSTFEAQGQTRDDIYKHTREIVDNIGEYSYPEGVDLLPRPMGQDPDALLEKRAWAGLKKRGKDKERDYRARLEEELEIFKAKGFSPFMLMIANMIRWAKGQGIRVGPGRGSVAGSLVAYSLGIHEADPLEHGLLFFRFINPERNDFPDVDVDIEDRRRHEVKDYMLRTYGHVASIVTWGKFAGKNSVRDAARVFMVPLSDVNRALKGADYPSNAPFFDLWLATPKGKEFKSRYPEVVELAQYLYGRIRSQGLHAGGLVVSSEPINRYAPMQSVKEPGNEAGTRIPVVALDKDQCEEIGLIKQDVLGLKALSNIADTLEFIKERHGKEIELTDLDYDDKSVYQMLSEGYTKGVFQCEQPAYTGMLIRMGGVSNFAELAASNALVRPGSMDSTAGKSYIARKEGSDYVTYHHPLMKEFTEETYGTIIYQEQVMLTMTELAGMKMTTADKVRKIIGKKRDVSEFEQYKKEFIDGASENVPAAIAEMLWHDFEAHANYSFNKSHAVVYSMLSYWTAWLKYYYPLEFICAVLRNEKDKDARLDYLIEAKRLGLRIVLPHVNQSGIKFDIQSDAEGDYLRFGLGNIKYISDKVGAKLLEYRPFESYSELYEKVTEKGSGLSTRTLQGLNAVGAAAFADHPRTGDERENFYEYLAIPAFEIQNLEPRIMAQFRPLIDFDSEDAFVTMGMVRAIKTGDGWSRVEVVDETGSAGIFADANTPIESGQMYVFLVSANRIVRYITVQELVENKGGAFQEFLEARAFPDVPEGMLRVVAFNSRETKAGKRMANAVFADASKNLTAAMVFPMQFYKAYTKCTDGAVVDVQIMQTKDGANFVGNIL